MEQLSGYEIAQQRIESRQKQRFRAGTALAMFGMLVVLSLLGGSSVSFCTLPLMVIFGFFALIGGIQLYYASPRSAPSAQVVADEMGWLFGDGWRDIAGTQEFMLAQERIRHRRNVRAYFLLHAAIFLLINVLILRPELTSLSIVGSRSLVIPLIWLAFLASHAFEAFPSRRRLANREHEFGQAILDKMQHSTSDKDKSNEKPKNDVQYRIGEDGELEEIKYEFTFNEDEKPKHDQES